MSTPISTSNYLTPHPSPKHQHVVSSLTQQCLTNLRRGTSTPKTHLLGFMSQYIQDQQQIKIQQVDQLCCYDRMKKLLIKTDDTTQERKEQEGTLVKAMQIEARMNALEKELSGSVKGKGSVKGNGFGENNNSAINLKAAEYSKFPTRSTTPKSTQKKSKTQHFSFKPTMIDNLKQKGYQKFFQFQKIKKQTNLQKIKSIIGQQVQNKFSKVITQKDYQKQKLLSDNRLLQRKILQKNVELQTLRQQTTYLKQTIHQLQEKLFGANSQLQNAHLIASYQKWLSEYKQHFGEMSISQLSRYIDSIKLKCLDKFDLIENKNQERLIQMGKQNDQRCGKLRKQVQKLEKRENQLLQVTKNLKLNKEISSLQVNQLLRAKKQLQQLRQLIVSLYSQWYQKRTQSQKLVLKSFGKLKENYSYQQMLNYVVFYDAKMATNDKLNQYILKILRGIQKIRRLIYPMQSNEKLDPFLVMEKIEGWVQNRLKERVNKNTGERVAVLRSKGNLKEVEENRKFFEDGE